MTNKIVAIQGDNLKKINIKTDTTIFLANEAQNKGYKLFYYYPENLSNIRGKTVSEGYFIKIDYSKKKFYKIIKKSNHLKAGSRNSKRGLGCHQHSRWHQK